MKKLIDLHVHTTASDGTMTPIEVVKYAKLKNVIAIAITDHDTLAGYSELIHSNIDGVEIIPGIELSTEYRGELHILGYYINETDSFKKQLESQRDSRDVRNKRIIEKLNSIGMNITSEEVQEQAKGESIGRPHIGSVLINKGYCKRMDETFEKYIGEGKIAYVERQRISPEEGIAMILAAGGVPVLAHPKFLNLSFNKLDKLIERLKNEGLAGIEAYYSMNTVSETGEYLRLAIKHNLIATAGSDFHGKNKPEIDLGTGRGNMDYSYEIVKKLKQKAGRE